MSKVAQEKLAWQYHRSYGLRTVVTRGFNHEGPRRGEVFVTSSFAKQIAMIEARLKNPPVAYLGDLSSEHVSVIGRKVEEAKRMRLYENSMRLSNVTKDVVLQCQMWRR